MGEVPGPLFFESVVGKYSSNPADCSNTFLFLAYVGQPLGIEFSMAHISNPTKIEFYDNGILTAVYNYPGGSTVPTHAVIYDATNPLTYSSTGYKRIKVYEMTAGGPAELVFADIVVINKIEQFNILAPPICKDAIVNGHVDYTFSINTAPYHPSDILIDMSSYFSPSTPAHYTGGLAGLTPFQRRLACTAMEKHRIVANFNATMGGSTFTIPPMIINGSSYPGPSWASIKDHVISNVELAAVFDAYPDISFLSLSASFNDGIQTYYVDMDIPVLHDISMTGTSYSSVDVFFHTNSYTVGGTGNQVGYEPVTSATFETWTPTSNPVTQVYGGSQPVYRIFGDLIVPAGTRLTLKDMRIEFGPNARLIVQTEPGTNKNGGILMLDNSTLTAYRGCSGTSANMWLGVQVWGNKTKNQEFSLITSGTNHQGILSMNNNSEISYAEMGAQAYRVEGDYCDASGCAQSGGIIIASNSRFFNNRRALYFDKYVWSPGDGVYTPNKSSITKCTFEHTAEPMYYPWRGFIVGWGCKALNIKGNTFVDNDPATKLTGFGIYTSEMGMNIAALTPLIGAATPNTFINLNTGIHNNSLFGGAALTATGNVFTDVAFGIWTRDVAVPQITKNRIGLVDGFYSSWNSEDAFVATGVTLETGSGYTVQQNDIYANSKKARGSVGVMAWNTGSSENVVRNNAYSYLGTGNLSNFKNRGLCAQTQGICGLQWLCNTHQYNVMDIGARGEGAMYDGIKPAQGTSNNPAGNVFSIGDFGHNMDIYNPAWEVKPFNYYFYEYGIDEEPISWIGFVTPISTKEKPSCELKQTSPGNNTGPIKDPITRLPDIFHNIHFYLTDSVGMTKRDSLHYWVGQWQDPYGALLQTDLYLEDGDTASARLTYNGITQLYNVSPDEYAEFTQWGLQLLDLRINMLVANRSPKDLTQGEAAILQTVADSAAMWAKIRAQNWLTFIDGAGRYNEFLYPDEGNQRPANSEAPGIEALVTNKLKVGPNPVDDYLQVEFTHEDGMIEIYNVSGRLILQKKLHQGQQRVDMHQLPDGFYIYQLKQGHTILETGKLTKQNR